MHKRKEYGIVGVMDETTQQATVDMNRNPDGKGGFGDNPQNRNPGGWKKENTISYQYNRFINMDEDELRAFGALPKKEKTVAMLIAYGRVVASFKSLPDAKEIADRTEGKAKESVDLTSGGEKLNFTLYKPEKLKSDYDPD